MSDNDTHTKPTKISPATAALIREKRANLANAEAHAGETNAALRAKQKACADDYTEIATLKPSLQPEDEKGIVRLKLLEARVVFYDGPLKELKDTDKSASASVDWHKQQVCAALVVAGKEIDGERTGTARRVLAELTDDPNWIEQAIPELSSVWEVREFVRLCEQVTVERDLHASLAEISEVLLRGELPSVPRPDPREREIILASMRPDASLRY
jgi:hypothetical protein